MKVFILGSLLVLVSLPTATASCCEIFDSNVGSDCCNIFACNCEGPCWNRGCKTVCQKGKYPGRPVPCAGNNNKYVCCPEDSQCVPNCKAGEQNCCCTSGKDKTIISIKNVVYDFTKASKEPSTAAVVSVKYSGTNRGPNSNPVGKVTSSISYKQTTSLSLTTGTKISVSTKIEAGIPFFADGQIQTTVEQSFTNGETQSKEITTQIAIDTGNDLIPPYSYQTYQFDAKMFSFKIPFKATVVIQDQCGTQTTTTSDGIADLDGVAQFVDADFNKEVGPAIPVECTSPFNTPIKEQSSTNFCSKGSDSCMDNALCIRFGLDSDKGCSCAVGIEQTPNPCCAYAKAHPACLAAGFDPTSVLCPTPKGGFLSCCIGRSLSFFDIEQIQSLPKERICKPDFQEPIQDKEIPIIEPIEPFITECFIEEDGY